MIASITVTYEPDLLALQRQLDGIQGQVQHILVIDNGSSVKILNGLRTLCQGIGAQLHALDANTGIGHAQNIGIAAARNLNADMILLLDQDSEAMPGMVLALRKALEGNPKAAAAGPSTIDKHTGRHFFFPLDFDNGVTAKLWRPGPEEPPVSVEVAALIASGTLIRTNALRDINPMLENWFIDHVDTEWCFRIRAEGWALLGVPNAKLQHQLGDRVTKIWFLRWRSVAHHSPLRDYYIFRNSILLTQKSYVSWRWKIHYLSRLFKFSGYFLVFAPQRFLRLEMMINGIFDGLRGRTGAWKKQNTHS